MIKIVTDSTAGLPEAMIREHDIRIVPLYVHFGEQAFKEGDRHLKRAVLRAPAQRQQPCPPPPSHR